MPEPPSGQANRFYTLEFFRLCQDHLNPGGIVALRLPAAENRWMPQMTERVLSIHGALSRVFANVLIIPGETALSLHTPMPFPVIRRSSSTGSTAAGSKAASFRSPLYGTS